MNKSQENKYLLISNIKNKYKSYGLHINILESANPFKNNITYYEKLIRSFKETENFRFPKSIRVNKKNVPIFWPHDSDYIWQYSLLITKYVYFKCCFTNKILRTNQSFAFQMDVDKKNEYTILAYKFINNKNEVFYLFSGTAYFVEYGVWYPNKNLIIQYYDILPPLNISDYVNYLSNNKDFERYHNNKIVSKHNKNIYYLTSHINNIAHYVWNDISGINFINHSIFKKKIHTYLVGNFNFLDIYKLIKINNIKYMSANLLQQTINLNAIFLIILKVKLDNNLNKQIIKRAIFLYPPKDKRKIIWINIRSGPRKIKNQSLIIANLINYITNIRSNYILVIDGHSNYNNQTNSENQKILRMEKQIYDEIIKKINNKLNIISLIGEDIQKKIALIKKVDFFISYYGSPDVLLSRIYNKRGVVHLPEIFEYQSQYEKNTFKKNIQRFYISCKQTSSNFSKYETHSDYLLNIRDVEIYIDFFLNKNILRSKILLFNLLLNKIKQKIKLFIIK